jgi:hypothetical protein
MDSAKRPNSCSLSTPATILPALPTTSTTNVAAAQSGSMAFLGSDGPFIRRSAKTRSWERAEDFKRGLEEEYEAKQQGLEEASRPKPALVTVKEAVSRFLNSKRNENLADSTLDKLTTIFEKQFLAWATSYGFVHISEITTADLEGFRDTWTDSPLAKKKKQERLIGAVSVKFLQRVEKVLMPCIRRPLWTGGLGRCALIRRRALLAGQTVPTRGE